MKFESGLGDPFDPDTMLLWSEELTVSQRLQDLVGGRWPRAMVGTTSLHDRVVHQTVVRSFHSRAITK